MTQSVKSIILYTFSIIHLAKSAKIVLVISVTPSTAAMRFFLTFSAQLPRIEFLNKVLIAHRYIDYPPVDLGLTF